MVSGKLGQGFASQAQRHDGFASTCLQTGAVTGQRRALFVEAFEYLDEQFIETWKTSGVDDSEAREKLFHLMQALGAVKGYFQSVVEDGKLAKAQLDEFKRYGRIN